MRAGSAAWEAGHVSLGELALAVWRAQRRPAAENDDPLLVRVMDVVRPQLLARVDLVDAASEELCADLSADAGVADPEALVLHLAVARNPEEVDDLHGTTRSRSSRL